MMERGHRPKIGTENQEVQKLGNMKCDGTKAHVDQ
jgi:hypothetical protein